MKENTINLVELKSRAKYWLVRADGGKYYDQFKYERFVSVHHNEVTLSDLQTTELLLTKEKTLTHYKNVITKIYGADVLTKHQVTFAAKRLYSFIEEMSVGDYVIVPSWKSNYFLIGQIIEDVSELTKIPELKFNHGYTTTTDLKRRKVNWINEVPRKKINSKFLYSTLTMHHSIIEVTQFSKYIDGLISPLYFKDGRLNLRLTVNTEEAITTDAWRSLYQIIEMERNHEIEEEIIATSNVESPGDINLQAIGQFISENHWMFQSGLLAITALFGEVDIKGAKFTGLFPYLHTRAMQKLDERQKTVEVETLEKDAKLKDILREIDIEKARKELQAIRNLEITVDSPSVHYADEYQTRMDFDDSPGEG